jgi:hypothetical protein
MTVLLHSSKDLPSTEAYSHWLAVDGPPPPLDPVRRVKHVASRLEQGFDNIRDAWWDIARELATAPGANLAHTPTCAPFISDFGQAMSWSIIIEEEASGDNVVLAICNDPWMFRHFRSLPGVQAGTAPALLTKKVWMTARGFLARCKVSFSVARAALALREHKKNKGTSQPALLVYGHPSSTANGFDAYFGTLMTDCPQLVRAIHTDCGIQRAQALSQNNRTFSLHAWGSPLYALCLATTRWRTTPRQRSGPYGWLVRRAQEIENASGALAMTRWQNHCQRRWLKETEPSVVSWSWENHPWERNFVRAARHVGTRTVGSQDTDVGPHQINMSPASNPDGLVSIPDAIACNGPAYRNELAAWGMPSDRLKDVGSFRIARFDNQAYQQDGPVFVALSSIPSISNEMMAAVRNACNGQRRFLVKDHPMYPYPFEETGEIKRTLKTIPNIQGISAVFFGTGLSGLEGILSGTPTLRLLPSNRIGIDTLPEKCAAVPVTIESLGEVLDSNPIPPSVNWSELFTPVSLDAWRRVLQLDDVPNTPITDKAI